MDFLTSKTAALAVASAVRLPQVAASFPTTLTGLKPAGARPAQPAPVAKCSQHRADQSRYHAQCRVAMSF